jgi:hypothetical protein
VSLRLRLARLYLPARLLKRKLAELVRSTARAFDTAPPSLEGLSLGEMRRLYAGFSREMAERALGDPAGAEAVRRRLFDEAFRLGRDLRRELGVSTPRDVMAAARILYRGLDIDLEGGPAGDIVVRRCAFSRHYTTEVCRLMSSLDAGVLAGLAGGGELEFTERLTEGSSRCRARFTFPGAA